MIKYLYLTIFISFSILASPSLEYEACDIKLPKYFYFKGASKTSNITNNLIQASTCRKSKKTLLTKSAQGITGSIPIGYLKKIIGDKTINIISKSKVLKIGSIEDLAKKVILKETGLQVNKIKIDTDLNFISGDESLQLSYNEEKKIILIEEHTGAGTREILNAKVDYSYNKNVFLSDSTLYPYSNNLKKGVNIFKRKISIWKSKENLYVSTDVNLESFQLSRILNPNSPLTTKDISLKNVVFPGKPIAIILEKNGLTIKTIGTSQGTGKLGDQIQVKLKNNKVVTGKVKTGSEFYVKL